MATGRGTVYKRCGCRDPRSKRQYGARCPQLRKRGHGAWYINLPITPTIEAPVGRLRRGGYHTRAEAQQALADVAAFDRRHPQQPVTLNQWFDHWEARIQNTLRPSSFRNYQRHLRKDLRPALGHQVLTELTPEIIRQAFDGIIRRQNRYGRPISASTVQRIVATLRPALTAAVRAGLIPENPAADLDLPRPKKVRPQVWTSALVQRWRRTGERPPVAVWTTPMTARFLQLTKHHRLQALFRLYVARGLRRSEALSLRWTDINFNRKYVSITSQLQGLDAEPLREVVPKTRASIRTVALDRDTLRALRAHRDRQAAEALEAGSCWDPTGLVFTRRSGSPLHPDNVSAEFRRLVFQHNLPPIRLHDLRHGAISLGLEANVDLKTVSDQAGHDSIVTTADIYQSVLPGAANQGAEAVADLLRKADRQLKYKTAHQVRRNEVRRNTRRAATQQRRTASSA
ncbi:site-specific integrase [Kitasatospora sp. MMS16-BH015]|uniref:tyrosine-type recombinase/integrase n=1 Tax=Kitasatospora sp. MMS16-BH015 TaxID=2018025 RepID=UPI000CA130EB|nr:tyrosine-type recombinase/integrase [Kitasatospora sp. MMS16-BH015]AUG78870.1 site-specific integrase [Kitasatospora sp. MMS16-BH015]